MIITNDFIHVPENEISEQFIRASGPGGQHVNKTSTAVQLRFDVNASSSLTDDVKTRLKKIAGSKITADGIIIIEAKRYKSRENNRQDARNRLASLIRKAQEKPAKRIPTRPSAASKRKRLTEKKKRSSLKKMRKNIED